VFRLADGVLAVAAPQDDDDAGRGVGAMSLGTGSARHHSVSTMAGSTDSNTVYRTLAAPALSPFLLRVWAVPPAHTHALVGLSVPADRTPLPVRGAATTEGLEGDAAPSLASVSVHYGGGRQQADAALRETQAEAAPARAAVLLGVGRGAGGRRRVMGASGDRSPLMSLAVATATGTGTGMRGATGPDVHTSSSTLAMRTTAAATGSGSGSGVFELRGWRLPQGALTHMRFTVALRGDG
jgi:hypothetical protein